jgi:hypothetical protein
MPDDTKIPDTADRVTADRESDSVDLFELYAADRTAAAF